ncbi:hypothetical protein UG55_10571, partial [Frankia sp. EI5c]
MPDSADIDPDATRVQWGGSPADQTGRPAGSGGPPEDQRRRPAGSGGPPVTRRRLITAVAGLGALAAGGTAAWRLAGDDPANQPWWSPDSAVPGPADGSMSAPSGSSRKIPRGLLSIFGAPGTFGDLDGSSPIGTVEVPGWGFGPGQAAYMSAVAADGTVFIATTPFTDDQSKLTGTGMELGLFEPAQPRFSRLVIPSSTGRQTQPRAELLFSGIGGGD